MHIFHFKDEYQKLWNGENVKPLLVEKRYTIYSDHTCIPFLDCSEVVDKSGGTSNYTVWLHHVFRLVKIQQGGLFPEKTVTDSLPLYTVRTLFFSEPQAIYRSPNVHPGMMLLHADYVQSCLSTHS